MKTDVGDLLPFVGLGVIGVIGLLAWWHGPSDHPTPPYTIEATPTACLYVMQTGLRVSVAAVPRRVLAEGVLAGC